jgi:2-dehydropantoate 2-reductase
MRYKVAILGAGALGALYARELSKSGSVSCSFIARGERAERLATSPLKVNGTSLVTEILDPDQFSTGAKAPVDLLIVALKYHNLPEALEQADFFVGEDTTIISVMNGVDSEEIMAERFGDRHLPLCIALGMDAVRIPGSVNYTTAGKLVIGKPGMTPQAAEEDQDIVRIRTIFSGSEIPIVIPEDILASLWWKFMINVGVNQVSAVTGCCYRFFQDRRSHAHSLMNDAMKEVIDVAQKKGINLSTADIERWYEVMDTLGPDNKTSMLQDIEAKRKSEVEMLSGTLIRLAEKAGLNLPLNSFLFRTIKSREEALGL